MKAMIISAAILISSVAPVHAQTQTNGPLDVVVVSYADLDLVRPDQARVLDRRLKAAARRVCDDAHLAISHYRLRHLCIRDALSEAWSQVAAARSQESADSGLITLAAVTRSRP